MRTAPIAAILVLSACLAVAACSKSTQDKTGQDLKAVGSDAASAAKDVANAPATKDLGSDIIEGVRGVKSKDGPDLIVWGSSTLTPVLLEQGLVDEVLLLVYPVLLGRGKRLLSDTADPRELALVSTKATPTGVLMNTYRQVGSLRTK